MLPTAACKIFSYNVTELQNLIVSVAPKYDFTLIKQRKLKSPEHLHTIFSKSVQAASHFPFLFPAKIALCQIQINDYRMLKNKYPK